MTDMRATADGIRRAGRAMTSLGRAAGVATAAAISPGMRESILKAEKAKRAELNLVAIGYHQVRAAGAVRDAEVRSHAIGVTFDRALTDLYNAAANLYPWDLPYLSPDGKSTTPPERSWLLTEDDPLARA